MNSPPFCAGLWTTNRISGYDIWSDEIKSISPEVQIQIKGFDKEHEEGEIELFKEE